MASAETPQATEKPKIQTDIEGAFRYLMHYADWIVGRADGTPILWREIMYQGEHHLGPRSFDLSADLDPSGERHLYLSRALRPDPHDHSQSSRSELWHLNFTEAPTPHDGPLAVMATTNVSVDKHGKVSASRSTYQNSREHPWILDADYSYNMTAERREELCDYASGILLEAMSMAPELQIQFMAQQPKHRQHPNGFSFANNASGQSIAAFLAMSEPQVAA